MVRRKELNARLVKASGDYDGAKLAIDDDFFFHGGFFTPPTQHFVIKPRADAKKTLPPGRQAVIELVFFENSLEKEFSQSQICPRPIVLLVGLAALRGEKSSSECGRVYITRPMRRD